MKKLSALLNTPARALIAVGVVILAGELLIMLLIESIRATLLPDELLEKMAFEFIDPILLIILVSPALFLLIFKPMRTQQAELERQLDDLRSFQRLSIGRELRMKELVEEIAALRSPLSVEPAGDIPVTDSSPEAPRHAAEQPTTTPPTEESQRGALLFMLEDLEAARNKIEQAHQEWVAALDAVEDPIFLHDQEFRILRCNKAYRQRAGIPFEQIIGQPYYEVFPKTGTPLPCCLRAMEEEREEKEEEVAVGDAIYRSRTFSVHDERGAHLYSVHILEDITAGRRLEEDQHRNAAVDAALAGLSQYFLSAPQLVIEDVSARVLDVARQLTGSEFGYVGYIDADTGFLTSPTLTRDIWDQCEVAGKSVVFEKWDGLWGWALTHKKSLFSNAPSTDPRSGGIPKGHVPIKRFLSAPALAGEELMGQVSLANADRDYTGGDMAVVERLADFYAIVVQRMRSEKALRDSEAFTKSVLDNLPVGIAVNSVDPSVTFSYMNDIFPRLYRTTRDKLADPNAFWDAVYEDPEFRKKISKQVLEDCASGDVERMHWDDVPITRKGEETVFVTARNIPVPGKRLMISIVLDVTARKQAEAEIKHANRALATLSAVNRNLVHATDENELIQAICQAIIEQNGYRMAWVGYKQQDESKSIKIMAHAGHDEGYLEAMQLTWAETERGMCPCGCAIRSGTTQLCQDIAQYPRHAPWRDAALKRGYAASIALPLTHRNGKMFGILSVYAAEVNAFSPTEVDLLEEMAGDLAFGVRSLRARHERDLAQDKVQQQVVQLQDSLEDTVRAIATIVEMRDPYTAGHQARVADLAAAIAKQLGLPEEQVHGIHLAGVVHDLGKIKIPAEILSKPGKISDIEFSLIKIHSQAGYDILKGINFPWPIAQMVLQHHERLDGSGYPQGLKGEAILLEARILSVADVVEAMYSHRPYRPGLGIEVALAGITKQRGIYYDPVVVDACLTLFREQSYTFKS